MSVAKNQKKWIVRDAGGRIYGPFSTEQVFAQIDKNYFLGGEHVASYPGGDWVALTKAPEFCDRLLDVLAAEVKSSSSGGAAPGATGHAGSSDSRDPQAKSKSKSKTTATVTPSAQITIKEITLATPMADADSEELATSVGPVIELTDLKAFERLQQLKVSRVPLMVIAAGVVLAVGAIFFSGGQSPFENRVRLLAPKKGQGALSESKLKERFKRAIASFQLDTFNGYQRAENELVEIIEGASLKPEDALKKAEPLSFLCMTYRELWPFAFQDAKDMKTVNDVVQEAKRLDPGGLHGSVCELVSLMLNGRSRDAQGLSESVLLEKSQAAVLFEIRGDLFAVSKDPTSAVGYYSQARALWPGWQKNSVGEARAHAELKQFPKAIQLYRDVLAKVPDHGVAKIELGLIEALEFNQYDKGVDLIDAGVDEKVPRLIMAKGYAGKSQVYMKKQQRARALDAAKKALELDPGNKEYKELVVMLGGSDKVKRGESDLMFLGEQYMRGGDFFSAQAQFRAAFEANPKNAIAAMKAGKCLWQLNQSSDAIDWMRKAIRADGQLTSAYVELADYYAQRFDYFAAVETLKRVQSFQPNNFEVFRGFAMVELRRNNYQGAIGYGQRALKLYETDMDTLLLMAKAHLGLQQYPEAQKFVARAVDLDFNSTEAHALTAKVEAGLHGVESGANYIQSLLNRYVITQGRQVPQAAIDLRIVLGEIYMQDERFKQAEEVTRQALALDANSKKALMGVGKAIQAQGQNAAALEYYLKAAVLDPSDAEPLFLSGQLYLDTGNFAEAWKQFERVIRANSRYPKAHSALGRTALRRGDPKKALEEAMQERAVNPDLSDAYILAAEAYFALHQYSNCAGEYQKAVSKRQQSAIILVRMARCYRLTGALESAQSLLREATALESGNPDIYKEQGAIFHTKGMADEAIGAYDTYLRLAPNAVDRGDVENRIRKVQSGDMTVGE